MNYMRNAWYVGAWSHDVETNVPLAIKILGQPIVIWRNQTGALAALEDRCVHRLAPLSLGRCEGEKLRCMYHGLLFGPDGVVAEIPGQDLVPAQARVQTYAIVERHSWIWIWMGDPADADPSLIPPAIGLDHPDYVLGHGSLDYAAEASLINDNLLDFSHLSYVHANSFRASETFARNLPKIIALERGVRIQRWTENTTNGPRGDRSEPVDAWSSYDFLAPGVLLMEGASFPTGTAQACNLERPDMDDAIDGRTFTSQAVTPISDRSSRYFFSWGPHRDHGDAAVRDALMSVAHMAFGEDKVMIEAQQRVINETASPRFMPTAHDRGVTMFNAIVQRLIKAETSSDTQQDTG